MILYAKVGTGPGGYIRIYRKRKLPEIGERIKFKPCDDKWGRWRSGIVDGIRAVRGEVMYVVERF